MCTIIIVHNTVTQRQFLLIFPFLQTNITSQIWPSGVKGKGGGVERETNGEVKNIMFLVRLDWRTHKNSICSLTVADGS